MEKVKLYQKILNVMEAIDYLQKDDDIAFGNTKYKAISEEKVTRTVREQLIKNKLIILPIEQDHKKDGNLSTVDVKYKIVDVETGESEVLVSSGTGADSQDKGVGKAMTYAYKYLFLRTFAIPTGEDPDKVSNAELEEKERKQQEKIAKDVKIKYQAGRGSLDGFVEWEKSQLDKGHNHKQMLDMLTKALMKKESAQSA